MVADLIKWNWGPPV